jgi:endonuclease YncB( thermonuclease family)
MKPQGRFIQSQKFRATVYPQQIHNLKDAFIARRPVDCSPVSLDQYGRTVAVCSIAGVDLADWLVRNGLALDWPKVLKGEVR